MKHKSFLTILISNLIFIFGIFILNWDIRRLITAYWLELSASLILLQIIELFFLLEKKKGKHTFNNFAFSSSMSPFLFLCSLVLVCFVIIPSTIERMSDGSYILSSIPFGFIGITLLGFLFNQALILPSKIKQIPDLRKIELSYFGIVWIYLAFTVFFTTRMISDQKMSAGFLLIFAFVKFITDYANYCRDKYFWKNPQYIEDHK